MKKMENKQFENDFKNPPAKNRIKPFWFWNGDMNEEEVAHQIEEMRDKGLGGAFICPRQGLGVPYLSRKWFDMVGFACEKANEVGIENWLYDEYPYPSGMSGGEVLLRNPDAEHMQLKVKTFDWDGERELEEELGWGEILYAKAVQIKENKELDWKNIESLEEQIGILQQQEIYQQTGLTAYNHKRFFSYGPKHILTGTLPKGNWRIFCFYQENMGDFKYYGGFFDPCNKEAVKTFIDTTHEKYKKHLGVQFGKTIHGMFSDETGLLGSIPWSKELIKEFKTRKGYDLIEALPALSGTTYPNYLQVRYDYMDVLHNIFVESYHKQVSDWCQSHDMKYATEVPSMRMSTQRYSDVIGGDTAHEKLGRSLDWIYNKYLGGFRYNSRSTASLARQLDKEYSMIESFHSVGWSMTMQDAKWMIDRLGSDGINLFNFHAFYYTIDAITKHDAPPSQFLQNPYWKHYKKLADYTGRMSVLNTYSTVVSDIAVLDPLASLWALLANPFHEFKYGGQDLEEKAKSEKLHEDWKWVCKTILFEQMNYDNLDTEILKDGTIENGGITLGRAKYKTIIIPPIILLEPYAVEKIKAFLDAGGTVIQLGSVDVFAADSRIQYLKTDDIQTDEIFKAKFLTCLEQMKQEEARFIPQKEAAQSFITTKRIGKEEETFFFISNQENKYVTGTLVVGKEECKGACKWNLETGEKTPIAITNGKIELHFVPFESHCIELVEQARTVQVEKALPVLTIDTNELMELSIEGKNVLRLEYFQFSLDKKNWQRVDTKTGIEQIAETGQLLGDQISYEGMFGTPKILKPAYPLTLYYEAEFKIEVIPACIELLMDKGTILQDYVITINGEKISSTEWKHRFINDQNNIVKEITSHLKLGVNKIEIEVLATDDSSGIRDPLYLLGDFAVKPDAVCPVILPMVTQGIYTDSYIEGLPYYSGTCCLKKQFYVEEDKYLQGSVLEFDFKNSRYDCMEVYINKVSIGVKAFTPYQWEIPKGILKAGENNLELHITNSLANMLDGTYFDYEKHQLVTI